MINNALVRAWRTPNSRTAINVPFQHGKSWLGSIYFPAWVLLLWPETRIALGSYEEGFACNFGGKVRDVVRRFGPAFGIRVRDDTSAKGEWVIDGHGGGMVCKGRGGALVGRPADLLILDDLIKNAEEAQSPTILEGIWDWYSTVAYSRLGPTAPIIGIGTRWGPRDIFGRWEAEAKVGGDQFEVINFSAVAEEGDVLGRRPGEALWPERVPLARLLRIAQTRPRWFRACWQGKPQEIEGLHFQPRAWPRYTDVGDAWRVHGGVQWANHRKLDCTILVAVDWAQAGKKASNKTAIVTAAMTPDGKVLTLDVLNRNLRYEENAPALDAVCRAIRALGRTGVLRGAATSGPDPADAVCIPVGAHGADRLDLIVASDDDMLSDAMVVECRRYPAIPEIRRLAIRSKAKIVRAQAAIIRSQNGMFLMPAEPRAWFEEVADQLSAFTGEEGAEDDVADCYGILGRLADEFHSGDMSDGYEPALGAAGYGGYDGMGGVGGWQP